MASVESEQLQAAADNLRATLALIDDGHLTASEAQRAYIAGALAAIQAARSEAD